MLQKRPRRLLKTRLTINSILAWADAYRARTGHWPHSRSGEVKECPWTTWKQVEHALVSGLWGLRGGSSIAKLLAKHRGKRNPRGLPDLTERRILTWADAHRDRTGVWPKERGGGPVVGVPGESWRNVGAALREGGRGLPGGSSLALLLEQHRQRRNQGHLPRLSVRRVLRWADAHWGLTGRWPTAISGPVLGVIGETWRRIDNALHYGSRGLARSSLAELLARHRGYRNKRNLPRLTVAQIRQWAHEHRVKHGAWPTGKSGPIPGTSETWAIVDDALRKGFRGLPGGSSLFQFGGAIRSSTGSSIR